MNNDYVDYGSLAALLGPQTQALQNIAMRPQKETVTTSSTTTSTPYALADMLARRDTIGSENEALLNALKGRETAGYGIANALAQMAPAEGYGNWATNALRTFGTGVKGYTDAEIARQQAAQELAQKDLETALAHDKAMGETQTQQQTQNIGYKPMEYGFAGGAGARGAGGGAGNQLLSSLPAVNRDLPKQWAESESQGFVQQLIDAPDTSSLTKAVLRQTQSGEELANRAALLQDTAAYTALATSLQRQGGATASMMNSDKEGQRALSVLENPAGKSREELAEATYSVQKMIDRTLKAQYGVTYFGVPLDRTYYQQASEPKQQTQAPQSSGTEDYSKYGF